MTVTTVKQKMERYFGLSGILDRGLEGFEFRRSQLEMAEGVCTAIASSVPLLVEAGTGTGKTLAYLVPAMLSGRRVVVSTGTRTLQDQILDHDIPLLKKLVSPKIRAVCLKGRRNYLCRRRYREFSYQPSFWNREEARLFRRLQKWAERTVVGDRAEIGWLQDHFQAWNEICSSTDHCTGQQCVDHSRCFLVRLRAEASRADVIVVNHHLFFADLALKNQTEGEVIPDYDAVIFDEAHQLEDTMGSYFGIQFSNLKLLELKKDLLKEFGASTKRSGASKEIVRIAQQMDVLSRLLLHRVNEHPGAQGRFRLDTDNMGKGFAETCRQTVHALEQLAGLLSSAGNGEGTVELLARRCIDLAGVAASMLEQADRSLVYWYEVNQQAVFLHGTPIQVAPIFRERLFPRTRAVVLTSATLSIAGSFDFIKRSLGLPEDCRHLLLESPFDFGRQAVLYVPKQFPSPQEPSFCPRVAEESIEILVKTRGRALVLFTSFRNMRDVYSRLQDRLPYPILVQGQKPKRALLAEFKEKIDSVLLAVNSFWQGIDVPGEALSCLMIDKLPFEVPDDPITASRMQQVADEGRNSFYEYQVPRAVIQLKQGVGRLIRSSRDRGIIVIFDGRLLTKSYGRLFIKSLPPVKVVHRIEQIDSFLSSISASELDAPEKSPLSEPSPSPREG